MSRDWTKAELEEDLTAYVDGELNELDHKRFEERLKNEPELAALAEALRTTMKQVAQLPQPEASTSLRRQVLHQIDQPFTLTERLRAWLPARRLVPALGMAAAATVAVAVAVHGGHPTTQPLALNDPEQLELAQNIDVLEDMDVVGLDNPDDLDVIAQLDQLEVKP